MAPWSTVAGLETALPRLSRRHKREHDVPESEAELQEHERWPWWRSRGGFCWRVWWRGEGKSEGARCLRRGEAARE